MNKLTAIALLALSSTTFASAYYPSSGERMERDLNQITNQNSMQSTMDMNQRNQDNLRRMIEGYAR